MQVSPDQVQRGFERLLESVDDLALDVPAAARELAMLVARGVIDDILPRNFLHTLEGLLPGMRDVHHHANECLALAHGHLSGRHSTERILRAWGGARLRVARCSCSATCFVPETTGGYPNRQLSQRSSLGRRSSRRRSPAPSASDKSAMCQDAAS